MFKQPYITKHGLPHQELFDLNQFLHSNIFRCFPSAPFKLAGTSNVNYLVVLLNIPNKTVLVFSLTLNFLQFLSPQDHIILSTVIFFLNNRTPTWQLCSYRQDILLPLYMGSENWSWLSAATPILYLKHGTGTSLTLLDLSTLALKGIIIIQA